MAAAAQKTPWANMLFVYCSGEHAAQTMDIGVPSSHMDHRPLISSHGSHSAIGSPDGNLWLRRAIDREHRGAVVRIEEHPCRDVNLVQRPGRVEEGGLATACGAFATRELETPFATIESSGRIFVRRALEKHLQEPGAVAQCADTLCHTQCVHRTTDPLE